MEAKSQSVTANWLGVIAGIWLIISPFVLGYANSAARTNDIWLGIIVGVLALIRALAPLQAVWLSWINLIAGIWLIIAPFALGYANTTPRWNDIILGIIVAALAVWSASATSVSQSHSGHSGHASA